MRKINILWTGGLDSTYRILELSMQDVTIQPYYLASVNPSTKYEIRAIEELTEIIKKKENQLNAHCFQLLLLTQVQLLRMIVLHLLGQDCINKVA